ncbi:MAG TPA: extracellular solute-binding protein [Actinophytocola sp.]|nr:extracellular solute-binding protein [Actinophytocola sp.]
MTCATVLGIALAACGDSGTASPGGGDCTPASTGDAKWDKVVKAAQGEGKLVWYTTLTGQYEDIVAAFRSQYCIEITGLRLAGADQNQRFQAEAEADSPLADVLTSADPVFLADAVKKGWLATFDKASLPALADWPEDYWKDDAYSASVLTASGWVYNTQTVSKDEVPQTWEDLLDPKWKGEILYVDPRVQSNLLATANFWYNEYGEDFLRQFAKQGFTLMPSAVPSAQQVAAGEKKLVVQAHPGVIKKLVDQGAPVSVQVPDVAPLSGDWTAVAKSANNPNAARLLMNWLMTSKGQELTAGCCALSSALPNVKGAVPLPPRAVPVDPVQANERKELLFDLLDLPA